MLPTHAVGIDLGTTYSCIAYLNEHGEPVTLPNEEGELATPSAVLFDDDEVVVGTEALRNAIVRPDRVVQNSKRFIGDPEAKWTIDGKNYTPVDIAAFILKKLIGAAQRQIGSVEQAVITVPAQFSDAQRQATVEAGHRAGLQRVDLINEPVAAALCYVLGTEGLWFTELAEEQRIMVYDLGGGTFDLSLVKYEQNEVSVVAGAGDLKLGGTDWTRTLQEAIGDQFAREFQADPRDDAESLQALALEAEQTKRSLTVRPKAALTCQHAGHRKNYQVTREQFERLTRKLVDRTAQITRRMLKDNDMGWAHVDVVLTTGGASRMPMIRNKLKELSGTTLNTSLSPDQSIAHGATYYAGMLLTNNKFARSILNKEAGERLSQVKQQSITARALGILVRDTEKDERVPHYLVPANTPLPTSGTCRVGTVAPNQKRVHLQIIESGTTPEQKPVKLGDCVIDELPPDLPEGSEFAVTISYDEQALVSVAARHLASGKEARTEIVRQENLQRQLESESGPETEAAMVTDRNASAAPQPESATGSDSQPVHDPEEAERPVPLCNECGEPLDATRVCPKCGTVSPTRRRPAQQTPAPPLQSGNLQSLSSPSVAPPDDDEEIIELDENETGPSSNRSAGKSAAVQTSQRTPQQRAGTRQAARKRKSASQKPRKKPSSEEDEGAAEFWRLVD